MSEAQRYSKEGREGWDPTVGQGNKGKGLFYNIQSNLSIGGLGKIYSYFFFLNVYHNLSFNFKISNLYTIKWFIKYM